MQDAVSLAKTVETKAVDIWLAQFERALTESDAALLSRLFVRDSYWRDVLGFDWRINVGLIGSFGAPLSAMTRALDRIAGGVRPVIDTIYPLDDFRAGVARLEHRDVFGKILVEL